MKAHEFLQAGVDAMADRATQRDTPDGERSMNRAVIAFAAMTGHELTEHDGWLFMALLKMSRATASDVVREDDYIDGAAYFALAGESVSESP